MTDWEVLEAELQKLGLPKALVEEKFFFIDNWIKENSPAEEQEDESLPGYSPGAKRGTVEEKVQSLEQTMRLMTLSNPVEQIATPSKAAPPAYTFEEGSDEVIDDEFSQYNRKATDVEANRLFLERERNPELAIHTPLFWLPKTNRGDYRGRENVIQVMDAKSFTTMAYDTAPRCVEEMIDVELYDRVAGIDKELSRVRLKMSYIQGVEANFANRSLIYGIDGKSSKFGFGTTANRC